MPTYQNALPSISLFSGDVGFSFNKRDKRHPAAAKYPQPSRIFKDFS